MPRPALCNTQAASAVDARWVRWPSSTSAVFHLPLYQVHQAQNRILSAFASSTSLIFTKLVFAEPLWTQLNWKYMHVYSFFGKIDTTNSTQGWLTNFWCILWFCRSFVLGPKLAWIDIVAVNSECIISMFCCVSGVRGRSHWVGSLDENGWNVHALSTRCGCSSQQPVHRSCRYQKHSHFSLVFLSFFPWLVFLCRHVYFTHLLLPSIFLTTCTEIFNQCFHVEACQRKSL